MSTNQAIDLFAAYATDPAKEIKGVQTTLPDMGDTKWTVARVGNSAYNRLLGNLFKQHKTVLESKGEEATAMSEKVMAEVYAKTILLGFEGEILFKGKMVPYSYEVVHVLCGLKDFRAKVESLAADFNKFKLIEDAEDVKN